jgi:hypothetical protein
MVEAAGVGFQGVIENTQVADSKNGQNRQKRNIRHSNLRITYVAGGCSFRQPDVSSEPNVEPNVEPHPQLSSHRVGRSDPRGNRPIAGPL